MSQPFSLGRVLLILLPGLPEPPQSLPDGKRRRSEEGKLLGEPRVRAAHVTLVHSDSCCNVRVDLDAATDARTASDVEVLRDHGFEVTLGSHFAHKTSVVLGDDVGDVRWPTLRDMIAPSPPPLEERLATELARTVSSHATLPEAFDAAIREAGPGGEVVVHVPE